MSPLLPRHVLTVIVVTTLAAACAPPLPTDAGPAGDGDAGSLPVVRGDGGLLADAGSPADEDGGSSAMDAGEPSSVSLSGEVYDSSNDAPLDEVVVTCSCGASTSTGPDGLWQLTVAPGTWTLTFTVDDYASEERMVTTGDSAEPWASVALTPDASPFVTAIDHSFLIEHFGGVDVDAFAYSDDVAGFQQYLDDVGVQYFSANEIVTPDNDSAAAECGLDILLPGRESWKKIGALALMADQLRALVGEPVWMRNWWRPACYNDLVGGAPAGDHPDADAVDLDFLSASSRAAAQQYLCDGYWLQDIVAPEQLEPGSDLNPRLNMSVGLGGATIHLGVLSANGRRFWKYASYTEEPSSGTCW